MPSPRTSFEGTANDTGSILRVGATAGLEFLPNNEPAPKTPIVRKPNQVIEAQAGNVNFPTSASAEFPRNPDGSPVRGGLGGGNTAAGGDAGNGPRE